jgi:hypothetical protein
LGDLGKLQLFRRTLKTQLRDLVAQRVVSFFECLASNCVVCGQISTAAVFVRLSWEQKGDLGLR